MSPANFYAMAQTMLEPLYLQAREQGQIRDGVTLSQLSQWVSRIILSLISYPEEFLENEKALRDFLESFLAPSLVKDPLE